MTKEKIERLVKRAVREIKIEIPKKIEILIERPTYEKFGDYFTSFPLKGAKFYQKAPFFFAQDLEKEIKKTKPLFLERVEAVPPGFLNFFLSRKYLQNQIKEILKKEKKYGSLKPKKKKRINIEFCSANPTGPLHLGHGRGIFWGDVLARVLKKAGHKVTKEYFINDYGKQILLFGKSIDFYYLLKFKKISQKIPKEYYQGKYIEEIADLIIKKNKKKYLKIPEKKRIEIFKEIGIKRILMETKELLSKIGVKFDIWFSEKNLYKKNKVKKTIEFLKKKNLVYKKEGALWFKSIKFGDDKNRILIRSDGEPTYFASDASYHLDKISRGFDLLIDVWGADHYIYTSRIKAIAKVFNFDKKLKIFITQFVQLIEKSKERKMSKRKGVFFTLKDLIKEVGTDVTRFFFLEKSIDTHIDFDLKLAKEQSEKNPVYYLQYAYVRINSILKKSPKSQINSKINIQNLKLNLLIHPSEINLIKQLIIFPEIIKEIVEDFQIQKLLEYGKNLATNFHQFYRDCHILSLKKEEELKIARFVLLKATKIVLENLFDLIGISKPKKM